MTTPELQERRRFARRRFVRRLISLRPWLITGLVVVLVAFAAWVVLASSWLAADTVKVTGTSVLSQAAVRAKADVPIGKPLARIDTDAIAARVETLTPVQSVDVSRCWPHTVCIEVTERQAVAVVTKESKLYALDESGVLFRQYARAPAGLPSVHMTATASTDALTEAARVVTALPADLADRVGYVDVRTVDEISLHLRRGAVVVWGSADESSDKAEVLSALLQAKPGASEYDVSAPGNPTVRP
jgi:cell division protein FtsQ